MHWKIKFFSVWKERDRTEQRSEETWFLRSKNIERQRCWSGNFIYQHWGQINKKICRIAPLSVITWGALVWLKSFKFRYLVLPQTLPHLQCDHIGLILNEFSDKFHCNNSQNILKLFGPVEKCHLLNINWCGFIWVNFWGKFWLLFIRSPGHTVRLFHCTVERRNGIGYERKGYFCLARRILLHLLTTLIDTRDWEREREREREGEKKNFSSKC